MKPSNQAWHGALNIASLSATLGVTDKKMPEPWASSHFRHAKACESGPCPWQRKQVESPLYRGRLPVVGVPTRGPAPPPPSNHMIYHQTLYTRSNALPKYVVYPCLAALTATHCTASLWSTSSRLLIMMVSTCFTFLHVLLASMIT